MASTDQSLCLYALAARRQYTGRANRAYCPQYNMCIEDRCAYSSILHAYTYGRFTFVVPVRSTSHTHLRDGFVRAIQARIKLARDSGYLTPEEEDVRRFRAGECVVY